MDENNNQEIEQVRKPTKKEKAEQAGTDLAEVGAKAAATAYAGPVGGMLVDEIAKTEVGQKILRTAGKNLAKSPVMKNTLAKNQQKIHQAKPLLNQAAGSVGGNASGLGEAAKGTQDVAKTAQGAAKSTDNVNSASSSSASSTSPSKKSGNFDFLKKKSKFISKFGNKSKGKSGDSSGNKGGDFSVIAIILGVVMALFTSALALLAPVIVTCVIVGQIMAFFENIDVLVEKYMEGREKIINFATGQGWMSNEDAFFEKLNDEYKIFPYTGGDKFDIALIASTIHYSATVDLNEYEDPGSSEEYEESPVPSAPMTGTLDKKQTRTFYKVALDKLGSSNSLMPGEKRLLGHIVKTEVSIGKFKTFNEALASWGQFLANFGKTFTDTSTDVWEQVLTFLTIYDEMEAYANQTGNAIAGMEYDAINLWYEAKEFVYTFKEAFNVGKNQKINENGEKIADEEGWFLAPKIERTMNYGYDEYKQMQRDVLEIKAILSKNGINVTNDNDAIKHAKDSSDTELSKLYEDYEKNESSYMYSYTHYLQKVYIPFTYFYKKEASDEEINKIVDEIYDQKEFYYYLMGESDSLTPGCGYSYSGEPTEVEVDTQMINNLYVNVLHYEETSRTSTNIAETVSLKDYVTGVLYREVGATTSDNAEYLKANIVAIKSYTVGRPKVMGDSITNDGDKYYLTMRNNTNDQVYCSLTNGCMDAPENKKEAPSQDLIAYIGRLYDEVANEFLYDSASGNFTGSYRDKVSTCAAAGETGHCMGQQDSKRLGEEGNNWETILASFYEGSIGIVDITTGTFSTSVLSCVNPGLQLGHSGYSVRTTKPTSGSKYFTPPWNSSTLGQCAWYAKGRALEIVDTVNAPQDKKNLAVETIKQIYANGNQWYHEKLLEVFAHSTDYSIPREGSIVVYDWVNADAQGNRYGHVAIVEKVEGDTVYISDGWNSCGGAYGQESWDCVGFSYRTVTIEQMQNLGRPDYYKFIGYVYLLD